MTTAEPLIKSYRPKTQVDGVDRTVQTGKVTSLRGPNCAGKVTRGAWSSAWTGAPTARPPAPAGPTLSTGRR